MTKVSSLPAITFENFKYDTVFYATDGDMDYQLTYDDLKEAACVNWKGAAFVLTGSEGSGSIWRAFSQGTASIQYDTCSVTDPNSAGVFYFNQTPQCDYVIFGWNLCFGDSNDKFVYLCNSSNGTGRGPLTPTRTTEGELNLSSYGMSCPIPVSSGDQFSLIVSDGAFIVPGSLESGVAVFWVQGVT